MNSESQKLESLIELATLLGQQNDYEEILRLVAQKVADFLQAESAVIMMINPQTRQWAGNIRELENFVERLVTLTSSENTIISHDILPDELLREFKKITTTRQDRLISKPLAESIAEYEAQVIRQALMDNDWNQSQTARRLKISEQTLRYKMGKLGIVRRNA